MDENRLKVFEQFNQIITHIKKVYLKTKCKLYFKYFQHLLNLFSMISLIKKILVILIEHLNEKRGVALFNIRCTLQG